MRNVPYAGLVGAGAALTIVTTQALAHPANVLLGASEIKQAIAGKTCTTRTGAKFTFGLDGRYAYDGLWRNSGRYSLNIGAIVVTLDNGLERSFAISRKGDVFYIEETALWCGTSAPPGPNSKVPIG